MASRARNLKSAQSKVFHAVEGSTTLLDLLEIAHSTAHKTTFIDALFKILPTAFDRFDKKLDEQFSLFTAWFGSYANSKTIFPGISAALQHRQHYFLETRFKKRMFISDIGLDWTAKDKSSFFSKVNSASGFVIESLSLF
jgi:hypothetical protein